MKAQGHWASNLRPLYLNYVPAKPHSRPYLSVCEEQAPGEGTLSSQKTASL